MSTSLYEEFLRSKMITAPERGIDIDASAINPLLKPHQSAIVRWAVHKGNAAIFAAFGLGKTFMQLEIARLIQQAAGGKFLIVAPLGVRQEFGRDAQKLGIEIKFVRRFEECTVDGIFLTNYETIRDAKMDPRKFTGCSLDEAAILRGFGGTKTFREFMRVFENGQVRYKFVATATPSPNEYIELLAYAAFLDVMDVSQAKTRFFKRNSTKADELTLHPHKEREFWLWVSSWAIFLQKPSDLGFDDLGYDLPPMNVRWHALPSDNANAGHEPSGQGRLVRSSALGVTHAAREKKESLDIRIERMAQIVRSEIMGAREGQATEKDGETQSLSAPLSASAVLRETGRNEGATSNAEVETLSSRIRSGVVCQKQSRTEDKESRGLYEESREGAQGGEGATVKAIRTDGSGLPADVDRAESPLSDLSTPDWAGRFGRSSRSRSQNEDRERVTVSRMQHITGSLSGQPEDLVAGNRISQFIVWCDRNDEQKAIDKALSALGISYSSIYGAMPIGDRERSIEQWRDKETVAFVSKPVLYGAGINLQQCSTAIFVGIGYKFSEFRQAIARVHRFLQAGTVHIHIIYTEAEQEVRRVLQEKWDAHERLVEQMSVIIRQYGLATNALEQEMGRSFGVERREVAGENYKLVLNDSVVETQSLPDSSVHLILTSPPFSQQYEYSPSFNDFGHNDDNDRFWEQMDFLIPELYRVLQPGRACLIHVKDRITPGGLSGLGFQTAYPFHCDAIRHFQRAGFAYLGMKTIVTDVVRENNQTYRLGWTEQCKDGSRMGVGMPEYLLIFRKPPTDSSKGYADVPVVKDKREYSRSRWQVDAHGFARSSGNRLLTRDEIRGMPHERIYKRFREMSLNYVYDFEQHVGLGEELEICAHCGHIHLGVKDDDWGKVCGVKLESEWVECPTCEGSCSVPYLDGGRPCPTCFGKCGENQGTVESPQHCCCTRYESALPNKFMLLQPQSWHPDVWTDITRMLSLNSAQSAAGREMHLCPMQFDLADRAIAQFSMPGETVLDPFSGLGTVPLRAIKQKRRGLGIELSPAYFKDACFYCEAMERKMATPSLFDMLEAESEPESVESATG